MPVTTPEQLEDVQRCNSSTDTADETGDSAIQDNVPVKRLIFLDINNLKESLQDIDTQDKSEIMKELLSSAINSSPPDLYQQLSTTTKDYIFDALCKERKAVVIDPVDIASSVPKIPPKVLRDLVFEAFSQQRSSIAEDASSCSQSYKDITFLKGIDCQDWLQRRNEVVYAAVSGLSSGRNSNDFQNCLALEHLYHVTGVNCVLPFSFMTNVLLLAVSNSKLAVSVMSKALPGGSYPTLKSWLDQLSSMPPRFPRGDCAVAIDNDQVVKKNWKVRVGQKSRVSIVTSVCQAEIDPEGRIQQRPDLAPR